MPDTPIPWVGLAALAAMFLLLRRLRRPLDQRAHLQPSRARACHAVAGPAAPTWSAGRAGTPLQGSDGGVRDTTEPRCPSRPSRSILGMSEAFRTGVISMRVGVFVDPACLGAG
jgi:hypothetical protein